MDEGDLGTRAYFGPDGTADPPAPPVFADPLGGLAGGGFLAESFQSDSFAALEIAKPVEVDGAAVREAVEAAMAAEPPTTTQTGTRTPGRPGADRRAAQPRTARRPAQTRSGQPAASIPAAAAPRRPARTAQPRTGERQPAAYGLARNLSARPSSQYQPAAQRPARNLQAGGRSAQYRQPAPAQRPAKRKRTSPGWLIIIVLVVIVIIYNLFNSVANTISGFFH